MSAPTTRSRRHSQTERMEVRLSSAAKSQVARAAEALGIDTSDFVRETLAERSAEVLEAHEIRTIVPPTFFNELLAALDEAWAPNEALLRARDRARQTIKSDTLNC